MSITQSIKEHTKAGPPSLTGSDVASDITKLTVTAAELTDVEMNSPLKLTIKPPVTSVNPERGKIDTYYPNKTSARSLIKMFGDDERKLTGQSFRVMRIPRINPTTNKQTMGLQVIEETPKRKSKK